MINLIFDIDGTLLHTGGGGKQSFLKAFEEVHNIKNFHDPVFKGGIDFQVYNELLQIYNIKYDEDKWKIFKKKYSKLLAQHFETKKNDWIIFKNVFELLKTLEECKVSLYVVTGNIYEGALVKLKKTKLLKYFKKLFPCSKETERIDIIKKCLEYTGKDNSIYIGDSDRDEEAAKLLDLPFIKITHNIEVHYNNYIYKNDKDSEDIYYNDTKSIDQNVLTSDKNMQGNNIRKNDKFFKNSNKNKNSCNKLLVLYKFLKKNKILSFYTIEEFYKYIIS